MSTRTLFIIGLAAAAWAGAHDFAPRENHESRDRGPTRIRIEARPEHRVLERERLLRYQDRREAWRREEWRRARFEDRRHNAPVLVVEDCHRPQPERVVVYDPQPVRGTISIHW